MSIRCIIGLGNPGQQYADTRHNVGAWFIDLIAHEKNLTLRYEKAFHGALAEFSENNTKCFLFKPSTYMNNSGLAVSSLAKFYKLTPADMLVAHDELDFNPGIARLKKAGGHGGHNGLRDIIAHLSSPDFYRLRIGVGHPGDRDKVTPFVLGAPSRHDHDAIVSSMESAARVLPDILSDQFEKAMHALHS